MTFTKLFSGVFAYEGYIPSQVMNNLNNFFPNSVDKTGETVGTGGGITGEIDWKSGSSAQFLSGSQLSVNAGATFAMGGTGNILSSGSVEWNSNSTFQLDRNSRATIATTLAFLDGYSIAQFDSGASIQMLTGSNISLANNATLTTNKGQDIIIQDTTFPTFSTPYTRVICQPLLPLPFIPACITSISGLFYTDTNAGGVVFQPLTKLLIGQTLTRIDIYYNVSSGHTAATPASVILYKTQPNIGSSSTVNLGSIASVPTSSSGQNQASITGLSEVISPGATYVLQITSEQGSASQAIEWWAPFAYFTVSTAGPY